MARAGRWFKRILFISATLWVLLVVFFGTVRVPTSSMEPTVKEGVFVIINKFAFGLSSMNTLPIVGWYLPYHSFMQWGCPDRNDVIVFHSPLPSPTYYMKRCIAIAGDTVQVVGDHVLINGSIIPRGTAVTMPQIPDMDASYPRNAGYTRRQWGPLRVPAAGDVLDLSGTLLAKWETLIEREGHTVDLITRTIDQQPATQYVVEQDHVFVLGDNRDNSYDSRFTGFVPTSSITGVALLAVSTAEAPRCVR
jgi:signal peptidase I